MTAPVTVAASGRRLPEPPGGQPPLLVAGLAVASVGGPLALVALYLPPILADARGHAAAAALGGVVAFAAPTLIWCRYSTRVAGPGGLAAFTAAAAGRRAGQLQAGLWVVSYLLYLLYTTDYVVYDLLPAAFPGAAPWRPVLEVALPLGIIAVVLAPLRTALRLLTVSAVAQLGVAVALIGVARTAPLAAGAAPAATGSAGRAAGDVALLFICASLPVFLGGEVRGSGVTVRRTLGWTVAGVGALVIATALPAASMSRFASADLPGTSLARAAGHPGLGAAVGLGVAASVLSLVVVEYLALARLTHAVTAWPVLGVTRWLAVPLIAASFVSLANPGRFFADLLRPSLVALWLAQLVPVLVYPRMAVRTAGWRASDVCATVVATALLGYGLYTSIAVTTGS